MAAKTPAQQNRGLLYFVEESTADTANWGGAFEFAGASEISWDVAQQESEVMEAGKTGRVAHRFHSPSYSGTLMVRHELGNVDKLLSRSMRDTVLPTEVAPTALTCEIDTGANHQDGSTGRRLIGRASTSFFAALEAAGSFSALNETVIRVTAVASTTSLLTSNRGPLIIKGDGQPYDDSTDSYLDIDQRCEQGSGTYFGTVPTIAGPGESVTLDIGAYVQPRLSVPAGTGSFTLAVTCGGLATAQYFGFSGVRLGGPTLQWDDRGFMAWSIPFSATGHTKLTTVDPVSGSRADARSARTPFDGGSGLTNAWICTDSAAYQLNAGGIVFDNIAINGTPEIIHGSHGMDTADGVTLPGYGVNLGFTYRVRDETLAADLMAIGESSDPYASFYFEFTDPDSNLHTMWFSDMSISRSVAQRIAGGDSAPITGQIQAAGKLRWPALGRLLTFSRFAA